MAKSDTADEDSEALLDAIEQYKKSLRGKRPRTTVDIFVAGYYYGLAHGRGEKPQVEPPAAPEEAPDVAMPED